TGVRSNARRATRIKRRANKHTTSRGDDCTNTNSRRAAVAEPCRVEVDGEAIAASGATEHLDDDPVLAGTRTDGRGTCRREVARAAGAGDDGGNATNITRNRVTGAATVVEVEVHPATDISTADGREVAAGGVLRGRFRHRGSRRRQARRRAARS